ncbi:MAG: helix-turn-helix domain-containing protein [Eubacteriales bacterium]
MPDINGERWISLKEACEYLGVTRQTILNWISQKGFPGKKVSKLWKFKINEIDEWVRIKNM